MSGVDTLRNLGPVSANMLREAGISTAEELRAAGAVEAYMRVKFLFPRQASLNLLWALHAALEGTHWTRIDAETKARLKSAVQGGKSAG